MNKQEFENIFESKVLEPLLKVGFKLNGKSLLLHQGNVQIGLLRGGGRLTARGSVSLILCFRHSFLRDTSERQCTKQSTMAEHYPWVVGINELTLGPKAWSFHPKRLMSLPFEKISYETASEEKTTNILNLLSTQIVDSYLPWAFSITPEHALEEMRNHTDDWWVARLWEADYESVIENT